MNEHRTIAAIDRTSGDLRFDDFRALCSELMAQNGECLAVLLARVSGLPGWNGPLVLDGVGGLLIADPDSVDRVRYGGMAVVGRHWSGQVTRAIARHLVAGTIGIAIREEGQPHERIVVTPGAFDVIDDD